MRQAMTILVCPIDFIMRSAKETKYRKSLDDKLTLLISLWIIDKLTMLIMFWMFK
jgi:hypothetical protein